MFKVVYNREKKNRNIQSFLSLFLVQIYDTISENTNNWNLFGVTKIICTIFNKNLSTNVKFKFVQHIFFSSYTFLS